MCTHLSLCIWQVVTQKTEVALEVAESKKAERRFNSELLNFKTLLRFKLF